MNKTPTQKYHDAQQVRLEMNLANFASFKTHDRKKIFQRSLMFCNGYTNKSKTIFL